MRRWLLWAHRVPVDGRFSLNDLSGAGGRMDEVARSVSTAFTISNGLREDVEFTVLFVAGTPARRLRLEGRRLRLLNPDERSTAALLRNALVALDRRPGPLESSPGIRADRIDWPDAVAAFARAGPRPTLLSEGAPLLGALSPPPPETAWILSDPYELRPEEAAALETLGVERRSVGPRTLRSSQVIDAVNLLLDRAAPSAATGLRPDTTPPRPAGPEPEASAVGLPQRSP